MGKRAMAAVLGLVGLLLVSGPAYAQDAKGLAPGWFSLDSTVGVVDKKIEEGKSAIEKALFGIKISGFWLTPRTAPIAAANVDGSPEADSMANPSRPRLMPT